LTLMIAAPLVAEVLPGATRFSALFVFPIEVAVWGGGALLIRAAVRHWRLGWLNMLLLALAQAVAEECLIQQTSLAPMVIHIKGKEYARAFGVNYVYFLWALAYEAILVVLVPVALAELIFLQRRDSAWVNRIGLVVVAVLFVLGSFLAWFSWTQIARTQVFHVPAYNPPLAYVATAIAAVGALIFTAIGPFRGAIARAPTPLTPPPAWALAALAFVWAVLWYAICLLAFGIAPDVPPAVPVAGGLLVLIGILLLVPRWCAHADWSDERRYATIVGAMIGAMLISFIGFIGSAPLDLYFKIVVDLAAVILLITFGRKVRRAVPSGTTA
jgi:hypothetical protein